MRKLLLVVLSIFLLGNMLMAPNLAYAQDDWTPAQVNILPRDGFRFVMKRFSEKVTLTIYSLFPGKKVDYFQKILDSRLSELASVANSKELANIETTSSRYETTAGQLVEYVNSRKVDDKKQAIVDQIERHKPVLEKLKQNFEDTRAEWRFIQNDINSLNIYLDSLK